MNNVMKKIAAVAMAFTVLGTGAAVTKTISPKTSNSITAYAIGGNQNYAKYEKPKSTYNYGRSVGQRAGGGIYWIQAMMNSAFRNNNNFTALDVDGQYGPKTEDAVRRFQRSYNNSFRYYNGGDGSYLVEDGIFGPKTYAATQRMGYTAGK